MTSEVASRVSGRRSWIALPPQTSTVLSECQPGGVVCSEGIPTGGAGVPALGSSTSRLCYPERDYPSPQGTSNGLSNRSAPT
jgi:hypothetical protein